MLTGHATLQGMDHTAHALSMVCCCAMSKLSARTCSLDYQINCRLQAPALRTHNQFVAWVCAKNWPC